ncbi:hypothetical protein D8M05_00785 [Oceanobacillus bengalensis]|uniref:DUF2711 family protein n=1 Tax=Oceanobacillus bengalensis TaxID=1435466 RepID=A0A494Z7U3_9BACI|nr:hypothetical protein D8M05_00785 [Oceanobacillus bengalensis]
MKAFAGELKWIQAGIEMDFEPKNGMPVSRLIPRGYESYAKIFQPIFRDHAVKDESETFEDCRDVYEKDTHQLEIDVKKKFTYKSLAKKYNIPYTPEISDDSFIRYFGGSLARYIVFSDEGNLDKEIVGLLHGVLQRFTKGKCYFYYDRISSLGEERLYYGTLKELKTLIKKTGCSPTYWWSEDRTWIVGMDYDVEFSLLGGSQKLVDALMKIKSVEIMEVENSTIIHKDHLY